MLGFVKRLLRRRPLMPFLSRSPKDIGDFIDEILVILSPFIKQRHQSIVSIVANTEASPPFGHTPRVCIVITTSDCGRMVRYASKTTARAILKRPNSPDMIITRINRRVSKALKNREAVKW